uniref:Transmembrane protein n=1 Tax=Ascaris lumbricoides TaxID=6252 RepID=A0A0M3I2J1_ASCLU
MPMHASTALIKRRNYNYYTFHAKTVNSSSDYDGSKKLQNIESMMFQAAKSEIKRKRTVTSMKEVVDEHRYREYIWKMVSENPRSTVVITCLSSVITIIIISTIVAIAAAFQCAICYEQYIPENVVT